jgi:hypothetical protein
MKSGWRKRQRDFFALSDDSPVIRVKQGKRELNWKAKTSKKNKLKTWLYQMVELVISS